MAKFFKQPPTISTAISSIRPKAEWVLRGSELEWVDKAQVKPTQSEIDTELAKLQTEYNTQEYARNRIKEYPSIKDQLDKIYHEGIDKWKEDMIKPVKDKHPKP
jgi:hypothetical protein